MTANKDQADYWSSEAGQKWATHQDQLDTLMAPVLEAVLEAASPAPGEHVLDIGCGTGASTLELAGRVGPQGHVTALDISAPLLDMARGRVAEAGHDNVRVVEGDAQVHEFDAGTADLVFSRFGVMFFEAPVIAFENLRQATRAGGRLAMICWQGAPENPWFMVPMKVAMDRLGRPEPMDPHAPGPMAFKDVERVTGILSDAGWAEARGIPIDVDLVPPQRLGEAAEMATNIGPATRLIREKNASAEDVDAIREGVTEALAQFMGEEGLRVPARMIIYTAVNGD